MVGEDNYDFILGGANASRGAYVKTGNDIFDDMVSQVIGHILPGGQMLAPWASRNLKKSLGLTDDALMNAILSSNMTAAGAYNYQMNERARSIGLSSTAPMMNAAQQQFLRGIAKTLTSETAYEDLLKSGKITATSYDAYIDDQIQGYETNPIFNAFYNLADPMGMQKAKQYLGLASSNMIRHQLAAGNRNAFANAKAVMRNMFRDDDGNYNFDRADYGGMNQGEVAALTAAITRDTDLLGDADVSKAGSLKEATQKLKDRVKAYSEALAPLKDIFGDNVPAMLNTVEQITGQNIATMGVDRARDIARNLADRSSLGRYSMENIADMTRLMGQQMTAMGDRVPTLNKMNATTYAMTALDMIRGGTMPGNITQAEFAQRMSNLVASSANSKGADYFDMAYAMYKDANPDLTFNDFVTAINKRVDASGGKLNMLQAAMEMLGVQTLQDLTAGMNSEAYRNSKREGFGMRLSLEENYRRYSADMRSQVMMDGTIRLSSDDTAVRGRIFDTADRLARENPSVISMTEAERAEFYKQRGLSEEEQRDMNVIFNRMHSDPRFTQLSTMYHGLANAKKMNAATVKAASRRTAFEQARTVIAGSTTDTIIDLFVNGGKGMNTDEWLAERGKYLVGTDPETKADSEAALTAAATLALTQGIAYQTKDGAWTESSSAETIFANGKLYQKDGEAFQRRMMATDAFKKYLGEHNIDVTKPEEVSKAYAAFAKDNVKVVAAEFDAFKAESIADINKRIETRRKTEIDTMFRYTHGAEGLANDHYRRALTDMYAAIQSGDTEKQKVYALDMQIAKGISEDALNSYIDTFKSDANREENKKKGLTARDLAFASLRKYRTEHAQAGMEGVLSEVRLRNITTAFESAQAASGKFSAEAAKSAKDYLMTFVSNGVLDMKAASEGFQKRLDAENKKAEKDRNTDLINAYTQMISDINTGSTGANAQPAPMSDILNMLTKAITDLTDFLRKDKTGEENGAAKQGDKK